MTSQDAFPGLLADRYTLEERLGEGGMATVWRARDRRHDRTVALKVLKRDLAAAIGTERFLHEISVTAAFQHPGILPLFDSGEVEGVPWYAMPHVAGESLRARLERERQLTVEEAVQIARQVASALAYAHQRGVVHRDVKPENIMLAGGHAYLVDFGIALAVARADTGRLTQTGLSLGTPQYLSPEQASGATSVDGRSDQWALAAVLYEMLAGEPPHTGPTLQALVARIAGEPPRSLVTARPGIPAALDAVVLRALQKVPADRYADIAAFDAALAAVGAPTPTSWPPYLVAGGGAGAPARFPWLSWRNGLAFAAVAALLTGTLTVGARRAASVDLPAVRLSLSPPDGERFVLGLVDGGEALSPDGRILAFVATSRGTPSLWIRRLGDAEAHVLPGTEGAGFPFWAPNGRSIGFFANDRLMRVDLGGGAPTVVAAARHGRGGAWTEDGRIVFGGARELFIVPDTGGVAPEVLMRPPAEEGSAILRWPQVLPGGRLLVFLSSQRPERSGVYLSSLTNPGAHLQLRQGSAAAIHAQDGRGGDYLLWLRSGDLYAQRLDLRRQTLAGEAHLLAEQVFTIPLGGRNTVSASRTGTLVFTPSSNLISRLTWFDRNGRSIGTLGEPGPYSVVRLSPNGLRVAAARNGPDGSDLWLFDVERNTTRPLPNDLRVASYPAWFPDSRTLLLAGGSPYRNLFRMEANGTVQRLTVDTTAHQISHDVCRNGRVAAFYRVTPQTQRDLWTLPLGSPDARPEPWLITPFHEAWPRFSPDCRWIAYQSDVTGRYEIHVDTYPVKSEQIAVTTGGGIYPQWARRESGETELFYLTPSGMLMAVPVTSTAGSIRLGPARWLFTIAVVDDTDSPYEAAPDGSRFLVRVLPGSAPLSVIMNWPALLGE